MKNILTGFIMNGKAGGVDKYLLNFLEITKNEDVQIDFMTNEVDLELKNKLYEYGSRLFEIPSLKHPVKQYYRVREILKNGKYDMVYLNVSTAIDCVAAFAAKSEGIAERVIHSHSSGNDCQSRIQRLIYNIVHKICHLFLYRAGTSYLACSKTAGLWLFPEKIVESDKFHVIYNAVDRRKFTYRPELKKELRMSQGTKEQFVIGHAGNFCYVKNYPFIIEVFAEVKRRCNNVTFLLAGTGVELEDVKRHVREKGLEKDVKFLGWCEDTNSFYHSIDLFLLPSRFEGLPIVGVEAQCTNVQCIMSSSITKEAKIQDHCFFLPLDKGAAWWAEFIMEHRSYDREAVKLLDEAANYDLENQKQQLLELARLELDIKTINNKK